MAIGRIPEPGTGIPESIIAAKGDILTGTANDTPAVLTAGTNETRLVADSGEATGLKYVADTTNFAVAAKGDLLVGTAADTLAPLTVGTDGHTLVADSVEATGLKWAAPAAGGKVLQVVFASSNTATTVASTTYTDSTLTATITPTSATSTILIIYNQVMAASRTNVRAGGSVRLLRNSTSIQDLLEVSDLILGNTTSVNVIDTHSASYRDSPATTASTTYKTQVKAASTANGGQVVAQSSSTVSTITLLEIGA